jgi:SnoaL-like polyketide cyclase
MTASSRRRHVSHLPEEELGSLAANSGKKIYFSGTTVLRVQDGLIVEEMGLDDGVTVLKQLGLIAETWRPLGRSSRVRFGRARTHRERPRDPHADRQLVSMRYPRPTYVALMEPASAHRRREAGAPSRSSERAAPALRRPAVSGYRALGCGGGPSRALLSSPGYAVMQGHPG